MKIIVGSGFAFDAFLQILPAPFRISRRRTCLGLEMSGLTLDDLLRSSDFAGDTAVA